MNKKENKKLRNPIETLLQSDSSSASLSPRKKSRKGSPSKQTRMRGNAPASPRNLKDAKKGHNVTSKKKIRFSEVSTNS